MKKIIKREVKSNRLKAFESKFRVAEKSRSYLEKELVKVKEKEAKLKLGIRKEKQAIAFMERAKRLRKTKRVSSKRKK
jgi:predicted  nucleic acid-binding Zn-ribbon protein